MAKSKQGQVISMRTIREIIRLSLVCGLSNREIAKSCRISHPTVSKYIHRISQASVRYEDIQAMDDNSLRSILTTTSEPATTPERPLPDWAYIHRELRKRSVTLQLLWDEYKACYPDGYQYSQFCEHYRRWANKLDLSMRQTHKAGDKLFVDYAGQTVPVFDAHTGEITNAQIFVAVWGASNYCYAEAQRDQSLESWINAHVRSFAFFGGVPRVIVPDNLAAGVRRACRYEPDINPTYQEMAAHYDCVVLPTRVRRPRDKAKVENGVLIVERWILAALRNRKFFSLAQLNLAITELLKKLNERPFKKLPGSRSSHFRDFERPALKPLPQDDYVFAYWKKARANIDYHIELNGHYYSVPYTLRLQQFDVRITQTTVEIFLNGNRITSHRYSAIRGAHSTLREHMPKSHQQYLQWTPSRIIHWAHSIGPACGKLIETIISAQAYPEQGYRRCLGILRLSKGYGSVRIEAACARAVFLQIYSYKSVCSILKNGLDRCAIAAPRQPLPAHENVRGQNYFHGAEEN